MAVLTRTHTKTFVVLNAWASTVPWKYRDRPTTMAVVGDPCAVLRCRKPFIDGEVVYAVIESGGPDAPEPQPCTTDSTLTTADCGHAEQWVCWRHVRPDDGPIRVT